MLACRQPNHPICIIKEAIIDYFETNYPGRFKSFDDLYPIVSTKAVRVLLSVDAECPAGLLHSQRGAARFAPCSQHSFSFLDLKVQLHVAHLPVAGHCMFCRELFSVSELLCLTFLPVCQLQNFDDVLTPVDHVSRNPNDTYYVDKDTVC